ncbi:MAG TPA: preprotein translocase subunit SecE [Alphaproteobacteria bacterium]|nr:preprotein translocase subunit SecE [Alphaproteobacteria bacterium]HAJ45080.1 preprotein translocase subunit SecE [Alphaproteobacteria bacterium]
MSARADDNNKDTKSVPATPPKRVSAMEFIAQVRQETAKVTWPTRKETTTTSIAVLIMVVLAMVFFFTVDWVIGRVVAFVLNLV